MRQSVSARGVSRIARASTLAFGITSCGGGSDPTAPLQPCQGQVAVQVTGGTRGDISWTPRCGVGAIGVYPAPGIGLPSTMWAVSADAGGLIAPGVRYGQRPPGAHETSPALPVDADWRYQVILTVPGPAVVGTALWEP